MHTDRPAVASTAALAREQDAFALLASEAPGDLAMPACGAWTAEVLVRHLATVHRWAALAVGTDDSAALPDMRPVFRSTSAAHYVVAAAELRAALADPVRRCVTLTGPGTAAWWARRQVHETLIHRLDLAAALGRDAPVEPAVAADCVAEVADVLLPRQVAMGRMAPLDRGLRLTAPSGSWVLGADPVAEVSGPELALALLVWRRIPLHDDRLTVTGDRAAAAEVLAQPIVP